MRHTFRMAMPLHHGLMTLDQFVALPEDNSARYELQEGVLVVSPRASRMHQKALERLSAQIERQLPPEWETVMDFEVVVSSAEPATLRVPDLVITRVEGPVQRLAAADVLLVVEIISPGSRSVDLRLKPFEYADAGIPHYWVVDLAPPMPTITVFGLGAPGDGYRESQTATGGLVVAEPFPLRVDIDALVARRGA